MNIVGGVREKKDGKESSTPKEEPTLEISACLVAYLCVPTDDVDVNKEYRLIPLDSL